MAEPPDPFNALRARLAGSVPGRQSPVPDGDGDDPLMWFPAEVERVPAVRIPPRPGRWARPPRWLMIAAAAVVVASALGAWIWRTARATPPPPTGTLAIESDPTGADVVLDGQPKGVTPITLTVAAGPHVVEIGAGEARREVRRRIEAGTRVFEYVSLPAVQKTGRLSVDSRPPGARVSVDGRFRGVAPVELDGLAAGRHQVSVTDGVSTAVEPVDVRPGAAASIVVPLPASPAGRPGWISMSPAIPLQIFEDGNLLGSLGTSEGARVTVRTGRRSLEFRNEALGFRATRMVDIRPGRGTDVPLDLPNGILHVNAIPWAEVLLDGRPIGATPLANVQVPIGTHQLIFRNPQFPEQRREVTVSLRAPTRLGIDLRQ